jgi:hypothetical protein
MLRYGGGINELNFKKRFTSDYWYILWTAISMEERAINTGRMVFKAVSIYWTGDFFPERTDIE